MRVKKNENRGVAINLQTFNQYLLIKLKVKFQRDGGKEREKHAGKKPKKPKVILSGKKNGKFTKLDRGYIV